MNIKRAYLAILLTVIFSPTLFAGWSEPVRLTYRGGEYSPQIIARNDTLHIAWYQIADSQKVSYIQSIDGGQSWGEIIDLTDWGHCGAFVDLTNNNGRLFTGWADYPSSGHANIGYSISLDGQDWSTPAYMLGNNSNFGNPIAATMSGDSIYGVYYAYGPDSTGNTPFRFLYSSDLGQSWSNEQTVAYSYVYCNSLLIKKCGGTLYIIWSAVPIPESTMWECQVIASYDGGLTWSAKTFLSQNGGHDAQSICASCNNLNGFFAVGWMDYNYPGYLYLRITDNFGHSWGPEIHAVTSRYISDPNIEYMGDTIWAAWVDWTFDNHRQLGFSRSIDGGTTWEPPQRVTETIGQSFSPWLSYDNGRLHLVWEERSNPPNDSTDIFYKWWESGDGIKEMPNPSSCDLLQCYPNPFNSSIIIKYPKNEGGEIGMYNLLGQQVKALRVSLLGGQVVWDGTDNQNISVPSGVYFARLKASGIGVGAKLLLIK